MLESERKLNEQYTELEIIYSTSPMGMCFMDTDLRYLRCNEKLAEINGISAADHIGRTLREIVPEIAETMEHIYRTVIDTGEPVIDVEASMTAGTDSQKKRYFSACYYPVKSEDGVVRGVSSIVQEITARVEVDKALSESQERYKQLVEHASDIIYRTDLEGYFTYINPIAISIMGYTEEEVLGEHFTKGVVQAYRRKTITFYERQLRKQIKNTYYEYPVLANDGTEVWLGQNVQLIWEKGQIAGFQAVARDITARVEVEVSLQEAHEQLENRVQERTKELTEANVKLKNENTERKLAETALKESEERNRLLLDSTAEAIYGLDLNGNCTFCNSACLRMLGYETQDNLLGKNMHGLIHHTRVSGSPYPVEDCQIYKAFIRNERSHVDTEVLFRKDGSSFPAEYWSYPINSDGKTIGCVVTFMDITERKRAEEYLLKYEHIVSASVDLLAFLNKDYIYQAVNDSYLDYFGKSRGEVIGHQASEILGQEVFENQVKPNMDRCLTGQQVNFQICLNYQKNGHRYMDVYYSPFRESDGSVSGIAANIRDITEKKQAEEEASMHRERLAHLVRVQTLGEMASGIAHEINQPLAAIDSYAQASRRHLQSGKANTGKVEELIEKISDQARRAGSIISHLRAMMQNKISNPVALDINNLLGEAAKLAGIETKNNDCNLIFKYSRSLPRVICDEIQIQQVALNLISNAVEAMGDIADDVEKNINVETRIKDDNYVEVCISDNGPGINDRDVNNIFEAFYTTKDSGLGMGLTICKSIIENHGGKLGYLQSKTGGARFYFSLPVEK